MSAAVLKPISSTGGKFTPTSVGDETEISPNCLFYYTPATSYTTGGDPVTFPMFSSVVKRVRITQVNRLIAGSASTNQPSKYLAQFVHATTPTNTGFIKIIDSTSGSQVNSATDLSAFNYLVEAWGV